jgi:hypothetical protein
MFSHLNLELLALYLLQLGLWSQALYSFAQACILLLKFEALQLGTYVLFTTM